MTCIAAAGIDSQCKQAGGINEIYMATVPQTLAVTPDRATGGKVTDVDDDSTPLVFYKVSFENGTRTFKEARVVGIGTVGYEKSLAGTITGYSDANNVLLEPFERGESIAIAKDNNGLWFMMGDVNPLVIDAGEDGFVAPEITDVNGYQMAWIAKDGVRMREIDASKIVFGAADTITITTT